MLVNLSKAKDYRSKMGRHKRQLRRFYRENNDLFNKRDLKDLKELSFDKIFCPTGITGVYWGSNSDTTIHSWCRQVPSNFKFFKTARKMKEDGATPEEINMARHNAWDYGVADSLEQIVSYYENRGEGFRGNHVIFVNKVTKDPRPEAAMTGWRWHKWGPYIGTRNPQCEYLNDEPEIEEVLCFSIYKVV